MPKAQKTLLPKNRRQLFRNRLVLVCGLLGLFAIALFGKLFYLQILQYEELLAQSEKQYQRTITIFSGRGKIYDRKYKELAANLEVESVYANPQEIKDKAFVAGRLSVVLNLDRGQVLRKLSSKKSFIWIKRKCDLRETAKLKQLHLTGIDFISEHKRFYPRRELAASLIGFAGLDNQGLAGTEHFYDALLKGGAFRKVIKKDARGRNIRFSGKSPELTQKSSDVVLTIDNVIQFLTEHHLGQQVQKYRAKGGMAVVMNPNSGEIYAMASLPLYNPNNYAAYPAHLWKNPVVTDSFEPGSIFKPVLVAAAIEAGTAGPNDIFFCENGAYKIGETRIGEADNHQFGWLSLRKILVKSSNIGAVKVAQKLGKNRFYEYIKKFGFGEKAGIDLPGETAGQLRDVSKWSRLSLASISFGQGIGITPVQMVAALSAIANGGNLMRPHLTKSFRRNGETIQTFEPFVLKRVISANTSRQMVEILKEVVKSGTGTQAAIPGYEVAGKTGTAQKFDTQTQAYSKTAFTSSFAGFVPADSPQLAILVTIDEPKNVYWGSVVAAPVFREIAKQALRYLNVPSNEERVFILNKA
ncbi:MAG: penicillin-binding protein 2 [Nitrospinota bacterium]|nr:penicillin-binding protein 2 [Nitrospinota bacterium]